MRPAKESQVTSQPSFTYSFAETFRPLRQAYISRSWRLPTLTTWEIFENGLLKVLLKRTNQSCQDRRRIQINKGAIVNFAKIFVPRVACEPRQIKRYIAFRKVRSCVPSLCVQESWKRCLRTSKSLLNLTTLDRNNQSLARFPKDVREFRLPKCTQTYYIKAPTPA